jgi:hypothetical protein
MEVPLAAMRESGTGYSYQRRFAAVRRDACNGRKSGQSEHAAGTAAHDHRGRTLYLPARLPSEVTLTSFVTATRRCCSSPHFGDGLK